MKKILPYHKSPYYQFLQYRAFPLCILQTKDIDLTGLLCSMMMSCLATQDYYFDLADDDNWFQRRKVLIKKDIETHNYLEDETMTISYIKEQIAQDCYVKGSWDEFFIPEKNAYKEIHFVHDYFIVGFDDDSQVFYSIGYTKRNLFQIFVIPYHCFYKSLLSVWQDHKELYYLFTVKYNTENKAEFSWACTSDEIYNYIKNINVSKYGTVETTYGLDVWNRLAQYVMSVEKEIFLRNTRFYMEHKTVMQMRLEYLFKHGYITEDICEDFQSIKVHSEEVHLLSFKFNLKPAEGQLKKISNLITGDIRKEYEILERALLQMLHYRFDWQP